MSQPLQIEDDAIWKRRYRATITYGVQVASGNAEHGLAVSDRTGVEQLYAWHVPTGVLTQLTTKAEGVGVNGDGIVNGVLSPDGRHVYYLDDRQGDETGHFVRVPFIGGPEEDITPGLPSYSGFMLTFSEDGSRLGFMAIVEGEYRIYTVEIGPHGALGQPKPLYASEQQTIGPVLSADGTLAIIQAKPRGNASYELVARDVRSACEVGRLTEGAEDGDGGLEVYLASPTTGDCRFLALSTRTGFARPLLWNPVTGERTDLRLDGIVGDVVPMDWSSDGLRILLRQDVGVAQRLYVYDVRAGIAEHIPHPGGALGGTEPRSIFFEPGNSIFARWESSARPPCTLALDVGAGAGWHVALEGDATPEGRPWCSVEFASSDGTTVQGWLGLPEGDGPFPTVIELHGGPEFAVTDVYSPPSQCWLDHGFAYLSVNYRGSTGFGSAFQEKIHGNLGHWEVEDIVAARSWLIAQGIAEPAHVFLTGWSYGGYLTLMALGRRPELWAGGMVGIALADLKMNDEDGSTIAAYLRGLMGGSPRELPAQYIASSPITYVEHVTAPVLILQGHNDVRCTPRQIEAYAACMREQGKSIEVHWFDSGHGGVGTEQRIQQQELLLRFVYRTLGLA